MLYEVLDTMCMDPTPHAVMYYPFFMSSIPSLSGCMGYGSHGVPPHYIPYIRGYGYIILYEVLDTMAPGSHTP